MRIRCASCGGEGTVEQDVRTLLRSKTALSFAQALCVVPEGGIRVSLPPLDELRFRVVEQVMGVDAQKSIVFSRAIRQCRDELHWIVDGNRFVAATTWRDPTLADWTRIREQEVADASV